MTTSRWQDNRGTGHEGWGSLARAVFFPLALGFASGAFVGCGEKFPARDSDAVSPSSRGGNGGKAGDGSDGGNGGNAGGAGGGNSAGGAGGAAGTRGPDDAGPVEDGGGSGGDDAATLPDAGELPEPDVNNDVPPPPPMLPPATTLASLGTGLVLSLSLDDGGGTVVARDDSSSMNTATLHDLDLSQVWVPGRFALGLNFTGGGGTIQIGSSEGLNSVTRGISLSAWVYLPMQGGGGGTIIARRASGTTGFIYDFAVAGDKLELRFNSGNGYNLDLKSTTTVPRGAWTSLIATFDQNIARIYVDGKIVGNAQYSLGLPPEVSAVYVGGAQPMTAGKVLDPLTGTLDDLMMWNRALTQSEAMAIAGGARPPQAK